MRASNGGASTSIRTGAASALTQQSFGITKTAKGTAQGITEKSSSKLLISNKASAEKKVKSRATSNNKTSQQHQQTLAAQVAHTGLHSTKNANTFNKLLERQAIAVGRQPSGTKPSQKKSKLGSNVPHLEMNKLVHAPVDRKVPHSTINAIKTTNRGGQLSTVLATQKEIGQSKSGHGTPSSNLNSQYALTAKKSKRNQLEIRRSSKAAQHQTMSAASSDHQLAFVHSETRMKSPNEPSSTVTSDKRSNELQFTANSGPAQRKIKNTGKSIEFSPDDSSQGSLGQHATTSPYQMQNKLAIVANSYATDSHPNMFAKATLPQDGSKSPEMVCSLKNMVTGSAAPNAVKSSTKVKKKQSHLSNSSTNYNTAAGGQSATSMPGTSDSAKHIQQIPKSQIKSIRHGQTMQPQTAAKVAGSGSRNSVPVQMSSEVSLGKKGYNATIQPLPSQKAKKLQIQMQFGPNLKQQPQAPGNGSQGSRPSTATQVSYLN